MNAEVKKIPVVGGSGGGKGGGGSARAPVEDPDSLRSTATIEIVEAISEGEIEGFAGVDAASSVYIDGTPLKSGGVFNFSGVTVEARYGTQDQSALLGQIDNGNPAAEFQVGARVWNATPLVRTITDPYIDECRVTVSVPSLLKQNKTTGDVHGSEVTLAISVQANGQAYQDVNLNGRGTIRGKASSTYYRSYRFDLRAFGSPPYNIKVTRVTKDSYSLAVSNDLYWSSYSEITRAKFRYPNTALTRIAVDAQLFSRVPVRGYLIKGLKIRIPSNYDPVARTYTGEWDGTFTVAWSNNPAWVFYDMLSEDRYGLGKKVPEAMRDKWYLYQVAQYCDELVPDGMGGMEPRFTCNLYMQTQGQAKKVMDDLASVFRGAVYWGAGGVLTTMDAPKTPSFQYTKSNVIDGQFSYSGSGKDTRYTVALVAWNNPDNNYAREVEYVPDEEGIVRYGINETAVVAVGCTSRGQAVRVGKAILLTNRLETDTVTFSCGLDSTFVVPGEVGYVADPKRNPGIASGRLGSGTVTDVALDRDVTLLAGETYTLSVMMPDGSLEEVTVTSPAGSYAKGDAVAFTPALTAPPDKYAVWIMRNSQAQNITYRVQAITESEASDENGFFSVTAVLHDPSKYALIDSAEQLEPLQPAVLPGSSPVTPPASLLISDGVFATADGGHRYIDLSWTASTAEYLSHHVVRYTPPSGELVEVKVLGQNFRLLDPKPGSYTFSVHAVDIGGRVSSGISQAYVVDELLPIDLVSISGLELRGKGNATEFEGADADFTWRTTSLLRSFELGEEPLGGDSGSTDPWFMDYEVKIYDPSTTPATLRRTEHVHSPEYVYALQNNKEDGNGTPIREFVITVAVRDKYNRLSDASSLRVANPPPVTFGAVNYISGLESIFVEYTKPTDPDYLRTRMYVSNVQGFTPDQSTLADDSANFLLSATGLEDGTYYVRLEGVDEFGPSGIYTSEVTVVVTSTAKILNKLAGSITSTQLHQDLQDAIATAGGNYTYFQPTEPSGGAYSDGDIWFDTDDNNHVYIWQTSAWADAKDYSAAGNATFFQAEPPTATAEGDLWFDTDDGNHPYRWNNAAWQDIRDGYIDAAVAAESSVRQAAEGLLNAEYTIKADVNGHVAGMGVAVTGGASGPVSSDIVMLADRFSIGLPASTWQQGHTYTLGQYVKPTAAFVAANGNPGVLYVCDSDPDGVTGTSEPWTVPGVVGETFSDGTVSWRAVAVESTVPFTVGSVGGVPAVVMSSALIADATIDGAQIKLATITSANIASATITGADISLATITSANIASATITGANIASATIGDAHIASLSASKVNATELSAFTSDLGTITAGSISIGNGKFVVDAAGNVTIKNATAGARMEIANDSITVIDENDIVRVKIGNLA